MLRNSSANIKIVQRINRSRVLEQIRRAPDVARAALSGRTGLSPASVSNIVGFLVDVGLVTETGREEVDRTGRKGILLRFDGSDYRFISVSHTGDVLHIYLTDLTGEIYAHQEYRMAGCDSETSIALLCGGVEQMLNLPQAKDILAVGLSVSALVLEGGQRVQSSALHWNLSDLRDRLRRVGDLPIHVTNNSFTKAAWLCRHNGDWMDGLTLFVDLSQGVGAALYHNGERVPCVIGEVGHTVVARDGEPCVCGGRGCLETMCAPRRLMRLYSEASGEPCADLAAFNRRLEEGSAAARDAVEDCAGYLGIGLANLVNLFNPDRIVLNASDYMDCPAVCDRAIEAMKAHILEGLHREMPVFVTCFCPDDLSRAMAEELCDALFTEKADIDIFEKIEAMRLDLKEDFS